MIPEIKFEVSAKAEVPPDVQRDLTKFLQRLLGPVAEASDFLSDKIRYVRFQSAINVLAKAKELCERNKIEPKDVPIKLLVPILEGASLENARDGDSNENEGNDLKVRWAALLTEAIRNPRIRLASYAEILRQIDGHEAGILTCLYRQLGKHEAFRPEHVGSASRAEFSRVESEAELQQPGRLFFLWHEDDIPNTNEFSLADFDEGIMLLHLQSLGLVRVDSGTFLENRKRFFYLFGELTPFGFDFVASCDSNEDE